MNAKVARIVSNASFIRPVSGFIKKHVDSTIDNCRSTKLDAEFKDVDKKELSLFLSMSTSNAARKSGSTRKHKYSKTK